MTVWLLATIPGVRDYNPVEYAINRLVLQED